MYRELRQLRWEKPIEVIMGFNVAKLIQRLNKLAHWVATLVLLPAVCSKTASHQHLTSSPDAWSLGFSLATHILITKILFRLLKREQR